MCESARAISTNAAAKLPLNGISVEKAPEVRPHRPGIRLTDGMPTWLLSHQNPVSRPRWNEPGGVLF